MAKEFEWRHQTLAMALDTNPATLEERSICVLTLGFAMKEFNEKWKKWRNLEVRLTENSKIADIKDRVRPDVLRSQTIMVKHLAEEKRPRGGGENPGLHVQ